MLHLKDKRKPFGISKTGQWERRPEPKKKFQPGSDYDVLQRALRLGWLKHGRHSKILKRLRQCDKCPLGESIQHIMIKGQKVPITTEAKCKFYEKGTLECPIDHDVYLERVKSWMKIQAISAKEFHKALTFQAAMDAEVSRQVETVTKGHPGFYTKAHSELAMKGAEKQMQIEEGHNVNIKVEGTLSIKDLMSEIIDTTAEKVIEVEPEEEDEEE